MPARESASDRTSIARTPSGIRLRSPDGSDVTISPWMASDILHDAAVQHDLRRALWESPAPFQIIEGDFSQGKDGAPC